MKHNIKMYLKKIGKEGRDGINLAEDRVRLWAVVNVGMEFGIHKCRVFLYYLRSC
jgi:hypothetical protein